MEKKTKYIIIGIDTSNSSNGSFQFESCSSLPNYTSSATGISKAHYNTGGYLTYKAAPSSSQIYSDIDLFLRLAEFGEQLANVEKNDVAIENILLLDYDGLLKQIYPGFRLDHSRSGSKNPYDEENELLIIRDVNRQEEAVKIYCPVALQQFTIAGYNVIKDCWLKFHSYRYTHCDFSKKEFKELLDLLNKIAKQIQIVSNIDDIVHDVVNRNIPLLNYNDFQQQELISICIFRVRDSDPLGRRRACAAPLQERRGGAAGAHGAPCNIARPGRSRGTP